jgi:hypothetical protein
MEVPAAHCQGLPGVGSVTEGCSRVRWLVMTALWSLTLVVTFLVASGDSFSSLVAGEGLVDKAGRGTWRCR